MKALQTLLQKEMTRQQFLVTIGVGIATVCGFGGLLKLFGKSLGQHASQDAPTAPSSYGVSKSTSKQA